MQRTLKFAKYLPEFGWEPIVLTAREGAYPERFEGNAAVPEGVTIVRTGAIDVARHLSIRGKYFSSLAVPDRWGSWWLTAVPAGAQLVRKLDPALIWSTYPIATAHLIALGLHRLFRIPWISDFRDPMPHHYRKETAAGARLLRWIERKTVAQSTKVIFTSDGALSLYAREYNVLPSEGWRVIENGYDEDAFANIRPRGGVEKNTTVRLLHSGALYPPGRDPEPFFDALASMKNDGEVSDANLLVTLRAAGRVAHYRKLVHEKGIDDIVQLADAVDYDSALREMVEADGLLVFQGAAFDCQIPTKVYEYLRAGRPIFALTSGRGDTSRLLSRLGIGNFAELDDREEIKRELRRFLAAIRGRYAHGLDEAAVRLCSRRARTRELAEVFDETAARGSL